MFEWMVVIENSNRRNRRNDATTQQRNDATLASHRVRVCEFSARHLGRFLHSDSQLSGNNASCFMLRSIFAHGYTPEIDLRGSCRLVLSSAGGGALCLSPVWLHAGARLFRHRHNRTIQSSTRQGTFAAHFPCTTRGRDPRRILRPSRLEKSLTPRR
jgi:hypothetical protein